MLVSNISTGTLQVSASNVLTTTITNANILNISAANSTITNLVSTNISSSTLRLSSIINAPFNSHTIANIFTTGGNVGINTTQPITDLHVGGDLYVSSTITSGNILVTGNTGGINRVSINAQGSTTNPAELLFVNSAGNGDFRIKGDGGDIFWQGGGNRNLQMGAFHGIDIIGGRTSGTDPAFIAGTSALYNLAVRNSNDSVGLIVQGHTTQTSDYMQVQNSAGTVLAEISNTGDIFNNSYLLHGRDMYTIISTASNTSNSTTLATKCSITTGSLSGGTYMMLGSWQSSSNTANRTWRVALVVNGTSVIEQRQSSNAIATDLIAEDFMYFMTLSSGVNTIGLQYAIVGTQTYTIRNARLMTYRIA